MRIKCCHVIHPLVGLLLPDKVVQKIPQHLLPTSSIKGWHRVSFVRIWKHNGDVERAIVKEDPNIGPRLTHCSSELTHLCLPRLKTKMFKMTL